MKIKTTLNQLGVETVPASSDFVKLCGMRYPEWDLLSEFAEAVPRIWTPFLAQSGSELCYLADERVITKTMEKGTGKRLLPLGAFLDANLLVLDTESKCGTLVGKVYQKGIIGMKGALLEGDDEIYEPFDLSYMDWLLHINKFPGDLRYI